MDRRVQFDFDIEFANGGSLRGEGFRLDIDQATLDDAALAEYIVRDLNLLMVARVTIRNKIYIDEPNKRPSTQPGPATQLIDLSHPIRDGMITYPGVPAPHITAHLSRADSRSLYAPGTEFHIGSIHMAANTGTYIDAPYHRYEGGTDIAALPLDRLVDIPAVVVRTTDRVITAKAFADVETWGKAVLIHTGWSIHFGTPGYLGEHPHLAADAAQRLVDGGAALVGIDSANVDGVETGDRPAHNILLAAGVPIIEHLTNLDQLPTAGDLHITAVPAPVTDIGSFPVRVVARISG